jgi:hypothetical protein
MADDKKVDESWKEKAKADQGPPAPPTGPPPAPKRAEGSASAPPPEFSSLVASIATGALMALGGDSEEGKAGPPDLVQARYAIDLLDVLATKTKGNLAPEEERHLSAILHRPRLNSFIPSDAS